jgi:diguanylate cyclase (GGDEF)-like protein
LIPLVTFIALIATTFITKWIFYIDNNNFYEKGTQPWLYILTSCFYLVLVILCALISLRKKVSIAEKKRYVIVACFSFIPLIAIAYKFFDHTNLSISQLCIVLALTCVYVNIQQQKITRDALSNLNNRFSLEKYLDDITKQFPENRDPINLIFIDILNFKKINDNFGHVEGDILVCEIASKLRNLCNSKKCFLARYSGATFAIVTIGMLTSEVSDFKETIKKSLEKNDNDKKYENKVLLSSKSYEMQLKNTKEFIQKTLAQITEEKAKIKAENNAAKLETK